MAQVQRQGFPYIRRQGKLIPAASFGTNRDSCVLPIDVFYIQGDNFTSTQTESGQ
jgi:hypothetical protein